MFFGIYTKKEVEEIKRKTYIEAYQNGYDDCDFFHEYLDKKTSKYVDSLEKENDKLRKIIKDIELKRNVKLDY